MTGDVVEIRKLERGNQSAAERKRGGLVVENTHRRQSSDWSVRGKSVSSRVSERRQAERARLRQVRLVGSLA